jgi:hypothetical protein
MEYFDAFALGRGGLVAASDQQFFSTIGYASKGGDNSPNRGTICR